MKKKIMYLIIILIFVVFCCFGIKFRLFNEKKVSKDGVDNIKINETKGETVFKEYEIDGKKIKIGYTSYQYDVSSNDNNISFKNERNVIKSYSSIDEDIYNRISDKINSLYEEDWNFIKYYEKDYIKNNSSGNKDLGVKYYIDFSSSFKKVVTFKFSSKGVFGDINFLLERGFSFNVNDGNLLTIKDISNNYDSFIDYLLSEVKSDFNNKKKNGYCVNDIKDDEYKELINRDGNWYFNDKGIRIVFSRYSVACDHDGVIYVDIDKNKINPYLKDEYKITT